MKRTGLDTGFFLSLLDEDPAALEVMEDPERILITSPVVIYELQKYVFKGKIADNLLKLLEESIDLIPCIDSEIARNAAAISHGTGIHMSDSLILATFLHAEVEEIYTRDRDFLKYKGKLKIKLLNS